jgi:hypothetical protein
MGGFSAYDLALLHPLRFCAVGGHSPALWFQGGETADMVRGNPGAFEGMRVWNDYGDEDPFRTYDEGFVGYLRQDGVDLSAHTWDGGHDGAYWSRHWPAYLRFYANALASCGGRSPARMSTYRSIRAHKSTCHLSVRAPLRPGRLAIIEAWTSRKRRAVVPSWRGSIPTEARRTGSR